MFSGGSKGDIGKKRVKSMKRVRRFEDSMEVTVSGCPYKEKYGSEKTHILYILRSVTLSKV